MTLPVIATARLRLRPLTMADAPALVAALADWQVVRWLSAVPFPYGPQDAIRFIAQFAMDPSHAHWAIEDGAGFAGVISVKPDLGYWLAADRHGRGYMTEAARAVLEWFFQRHDAPVISGHYPENAASRAVLMKLGFADTHLETVIQRATGAAMPIQRMALSAADWPRYRTALRSARLTLRVPTPADVDAMIAYADDYEVAKWTATWPWPAERAFVESRAVPHAPEDGFMGLVCLNGQVIGQMGIWRGILGYMFHRDHWGQGYATEIGRALVDHIFATQDWADIRAAVWVGNPASVRVLDKLGFLPNGPDHGPCRAQGRSLDGEKFILPRERWDALRKAPR